MILQALRRRYGMPCCGNLFKHGDCTQYERERFAAEGYFV